MLSKYAYSTARFPGPKIEYQTHTLVQSLHFGATSLVFL